MINQQTQNHSPFQCWCAQSRMMLLNLRSSSRGAHIRMVSRGTTHSVYISLVTVFMSFTSQLMALIQNTLILPWSKGWDRVILSEGFFQVKEGMFLTKVLILGMPGRFWRTGAFPAGLMEGCTPVLILRRPFLLFPTSNFYWLTPFFSSKVLKAGGCGIVSGVLGMEACDSLVSLLTLDDVISLSYLLLFESLGCLRVLLSQSFSKSLSISVTWSRCSMGSQVFSS